LENTKLGRKILSIFIEKGPVETWKIGNGWKRLETVGNWKIGNGWKRLETVGNGWKLYKSIRFHIGNLETWKLGNLETVGNWKLGNLETVGNGWKLENWKRWKLITVGFMLSLIC
jgi:hypothetical protein